MLSLSMSGNVFAEINLHGPENHCIQAAENPQSKRFVLIKQVGIGLEIENRTAYIYAECTTYENSDISVTAELQIYDNGWETVKTYRNTESDSKISSIDETYAVARGYEYRVKVTAFVKQGLASDSTTKYSSVQECYSLNNDLI